MLLKVQTDCENWRRQAFEVGFNIEIGIRNHAVAQIVDQHFVAVPVEVSCQAEHTDGNLSELDLISGGAKRPWKEDPLAKIIDRRRMNYDNVKTYFFFSSCLTNFSLVHPQTPQMNLAGS